MKLCEGTTTQKIWKFIEHRFVQSLLKSFSCLTHQVLHTVLGVFFFTCIEYCIKSLGQILILRVNTSSMCSRIIQGTFQMRERRMSFTYKNCWMASSLTNCTLRNNVQNGGTRNISGNNIYHAQRHIPSRSFSAQHRSWCVHKAVDGKELTNDLPVECFRGLMGTLSCFVWLQWLSQNFNLISTGPVQYRCDKTEHEGSLLR